MKGFCFSVTDSPYPKDKVYVQRMKFLWSESLLENLEKQLIVLYLYIFLKLPLPKNWHSQRSFVFLPRIDRTPRNKFQLKEYFFFFFFFFFMI